MRKAHETMVAVPVGTLNAIKNMLFSENGGVDLSNVINDLSAGLNIDQDLLSINVALTHMGHKPTIVGLETTRWGDVRSWNKTCRRYEFESYSLILDCVICRVFTAKAVDGDWTWNPDESYESERFPLDRWLELPTEAPDAPQDSETK